MKVLYVSSEAVPYVKTGGLADVAGSLPKALKEQGVDVRVILPKFSKIGEKYREGMEHVYDGTIPVSWRTKYVGIDKYELDEVIYYFVDNEEYFAREGLYGYDDDAERYSFFSRLRLGVPQTRQVDQRQVQWQRLHEGTTRRLTQARARKRYDCYGCAL